SLPRLILSFTIFSLLPKCLFSQYLFKIFILSLREKIGKSVATAYFTTFGYETMCLSGRASIFY
ncbi:hypothetical protein GIB67_010195, partial [Kingdonia uniflora]